MECVSISSCGKVFSVCHWTLFSPFSLLLQYFLCNTMLPFCYVPTSLLHSLWRHHLWVSMVTVILTVCLCHNDAMCTCGKWARSHLMTSVLQSVDTVRNQHVTGHLWRHVHDASVACPRVAYLVYLCCVMCIFYYKKWYNGKLKPLLDMLLRTGY